MVAVGRSSVMAIVELEAPRAIEYIIGLAEM